MHHVLEWAADPTAAADLLHSPKQLRKMLLDPQEYAVEPGVRDAAALMILYADSLDALLEQGLMYLCRRLDAARCDGGLGAPTDAVFMATNQAALPGAQVMNVVGLPLPNAHWTTQTAWRSAHPQVFDLDADPRCVLLRAQPALRDSRQILVQRMAVGSQVLGLVCADQVNERHTWRASDHRALDNWVHQFVSPLVYLHLRARQGIRQEPSAAEKKVIALIARGLSYKAVARELGKSVRTVSNQLTSARAKLGVHNEIDLVRACRYWLE
jgi:DNA-binding CsgD family transcriptional regulator